MKSFAAACFLIVVGLSVTALGQGVILPQPCRRCPPVPMPRPYPMPRVLRVKSIKITTKIDSQVATTKVEQVFFNDSAYTLEGTYFFPIPESAAVSDFAIYNGDKRMGGEIVEKAKARQIYNDIVRKMRDPGLLEYSGKNLIEADVYPIPPMSDKRIEVTYSQVLKAEGGTISYRYPLGTGRNVLPQPAERIAGSVEVSSPVDIKNVFSPSHKISTSKDGDRRVRLSFEGNGQDAQRDFQLYYSLSDKEFGLSLLTYREPGQDGYFLMLISPKNAVTEAQRQPKDIVFVLDTSGSMSGEKIDNAKAALKFGVESLDSRDRFDIISFSGEEHLMSAELLEATGEAKKKGVGFIQDLRAEGGTNINDTLVKAFRLFESSKRPQMIVFLTDGQPTVGVTDFNTIYKNVANANSAHVRLFSFGVGYDVNTTLLDKLSADNRGTSDYIEPHENLEVKVSDFFAKVNYPVLSGLSLDMGKVKADLMYPKTLPDLFKGSQITLIGRYSNSANDAVVKLSGNVQGHTETFTFEGRDFQSENRSNEFLPRLWATRRVGYLLEQIRLNGENKELVDEVISLGTRYGIVTPYTSFLITEPGAEDTFVRPMNGRGRRDMVRLKPADGGMGVGSGTGSGNGTGPGIGYAQVSGSAGAVKASRAERDLRESEIVTLPGQGDAIMRTAGDKTFMMRDGVWMDTAFNEDSHFPVVDVAFGSDEFYDLVAKYPKLADYFSLGEKVVVVYEGKVYRVK